MDRRHFFQTLLLTPFLGSLLANPRPSSSQNLLYLITDSPQNYLWSILQTLEKYYLLEEKSFSLSGHSPCDGAIQKSLHIRGWKYLPDPDRAVAVLSFQLLLQPAAPSFTLIKGVNILDLRSFGLDSLWKTMRKESLNSSLMTTVSLGKKSPVLPIGRWVSVCADGRHLDSLSLRKNIIKSYQTKSGQVIVRIKGGKASVSESSCVHKVCCLSAPAYFTGERIICAPNRFLLKIDRSHLVDTSIG